MQSIYDSPLQPTATYGILSEERGDYDIFVTKWQEESEKRNLLGACPQKKWSLSPEEI